MNVQSQASHMFLKEFRNSQRNLFEPFAEDLMNLMTSKISENLSTIFDKKEPLAMDIFQILGALLCN